jgi:hypothetical protein
LYNLGEQTYHEDKVEFEEKYPDRVAIDRFKPSALAQAGAGVGNSRSQKRSGGWEGGNCEKEGGVVKIDNNPFPLSPSLLSTMTSCLLGLLSILSCGERSKDSIRPCSLTYFI